MDVVSIAASLVTLIGLADKVISVCKNYVAAVNDAPGDLFSILIEVGSVKCVLETLELRSTESAIVKMLSGTDGPLEGCKQSLAELEKLFPAAACASMGNKRRKIGVATLAWPFKEGKVRKILQDVGRHKATICLALTSEIGEDIKIIKSDMEHLRHALSDKERESILEWLVSTDPSPNHNKACELREPHTGQWLTRSPEYQDWISGLNRFLWLHGIPGAGKTVLASFIVEDIKTRFVGDASNDIGRAYYYCYFGRSQDETQHFLRWVINQLCRQSGYIPSKIREYSYHAVQPGTPYLVAALRAVAQRFRRVYIIIDALDESKSADYPILLSMLTEIAAIDKISLLATSRRVFEIENVLKDASIGISLSNPLVDEDIRVYTQSQLHSDRKFKHWPESLRSEVEAALVRGAKGMFRWVACQLDILGRRGYSVRGIQDDLLKLPETLDETYERILAGISNRNCKFAHKALQVLAFEQYLEYSLNELADLVVVDVEEYSFNTENRFLDAEHLLDICTCLVTYSHGVVGLAHYTVKEYLVSERIKCGPAADFYISEAAADALKAKTMITYLLQINYEHVPRVEDYYGQIQGDLDKRINEVSPLITIAALNWHEYSGRVLTEPNRSIVSGLVLRLLDPNRGYFREWADYSKIMANIYIQRWSCPPGGESNITLAYACYFGQIGAAEMLLAQTPRSFNLDTPIEPVVFFFLGNVHQDLIPGTPLQVAAALGKVPFVKLFLHHGASPEVRDSWGRTALISALFMAQTRHDELESIVRMLLDAGADPNPPAVTHTPLQLAVRSYSISVVKALLDAGSDVNAIGDDNTVAACIRLEHQAIHDSEWESLRNFEDELHERGTGNYYDTPLRILSNGDIFGRMGTSKSKAQEIIEMKDLLISHGAKSLHLFPVSDLPGYNPEDMQAIATKDSSS